MKCMKILTIILALLPALSNLYGQRLKYKNVYQTVTNEKPEKSYPLLLEYQRQDPFLANCYYHLAVIADKWAHEYDPFIDRENSSYFIYNTKVYLGLARKYMEEKEARHSGEYYNGLKGSGKDGDVTNEDITGFLTRKTAEILVYEENVTKLVCYFDSCVNSYNRCVVNFLDINRNDNKIKDIYLTADETFKAKVHHLAADFDSTLAYFGRYRKVLDSFPLNGYEQKITIKPIETYRLEGLTASNFLQNDISLWDYGTWAKDLFAVLDNEINPLRTEIIKTDDLLDQKINEIKAIQSPQDTIKSQVLSYKLSNKVMKYDYQSLASGLLEYKQAKINLLATTKFHLNFPADTTEKVTLGKRARFYKSLVDLMRTADSLNLLTQNRIDGRKIQKHKAFFTKKYGDAETVKLYMEGEQRDNESVAAEFMENLKISALQSSWNFGGRDSFLVHNNQKIPIFVRQSSFETAKDQEYVTTSITEDKNGNLLLGGYIGRQGKKTSAFVAMTYRTKSIRWLKNISINNNFNECALLTEMFENGSMAIVNGGTQSKSKCMNTIFRFDNEGNEVLKRELNSTEVPRFLSYDDINDKLLLIFKGMDPDPVKGDIENLTLMNLQTKNDSLIWTKSIELKGNLVDVVRMDENLLVFCNFSKYTDVDGKPVVPQAQESDEATNTVCFVVDKSGTFAKAIPYFSTKPYFVFRVEKLDSETINLIGTYGILQNITGNTQASPGKAKYLLISPSGAPNYVFPK
jgi:hypothetical protein